MTQCDARGCRGLSPRTMPCQDADDGAVEAQPFRTQPPSKRSPAPAGFIVQKCTLLAGSSRQAGRRTALPDPAGRARLGPRAESGEHDSQRVSAVPVSGRPRDPARFTLHGGRVTCRRMLTALAGLLGVRRLSQHRRLLPGHPRPDVPYPASDSNR